MKSLCIFVFCATLFVVCCSLPGQVYEWEWATRAGGTYGDTGTSIATDNQDNQYITGYFDGTATFGTTTLTGSSGSEIYIAKLDSNGSFLWAKKAGGTGYDGGSGIAVDDAANIYLTGWFDGTAVFGSISLTSSGLWDIFIAKLDTNGNFLWAKRAGGANDDMSTGIALDNGANVFLTGYFEGSATFGSTTLTSSGNTDVFATKLDSNGNFIWAKKANGSGYDWGNGIAVDNAGNIYLTGAYQSNASFGSTTLTGSGGYNIYAAKLDNNGNWLWAIKAGGAGDDWSWGIATDNAANVYLTGYFQGSALFCTSTLISTGEYNVFAAKLDSSGHFLWAVRAGGSSGYNAGKGIAVDNAGNCYLTGDFYASATFGSTTVISTGFYDADVFVTKLNSNGAFLWAVQAGGTDSDDVYGIALGNSGDVCLTGDFYETAVFGHITLNAYGNYDVFVAKLMPTLFVPVPPENLHISIYGNDIRLTWDPVTHDTNGYILFPDAYNIYICTYAPEGEFVFLDQVLAGNAEFIHLNVAQLWNSCFYRVIAVKY